LRTISLNKWLIFALRLILGGIFIIAGIAKLLDTAEFVNTIASYDILSNSLAHFYGYLIPWVELFIGCSLVLGYSVSLSAAVSVPLIISFIIASSYALANAVGGGCGCFGTFFALSHQWAISVDVLLLLFSLILLLNSDDGFLSIGQLIRRLKVNSKVVTWGSQIILIGFLICTVGFVSVQLYQYFDSPSYDIVMNMVVDLIDVPQPLAADVDSAIAEGKPVVVFFYSEGCYACEVAKPFIDEAEQEYAGRVVFLRLKFIDNQQAAESMKVHATPDFLVIASKNNDGRYAAYRESGYLNQADYSYAGLKACIDSALDDMR